MQMLLPRSIILLSAFFLLQPAAGQANQDSSTTAAPVDDGPSAMTSAPTTADMVAPSPSPTKTFSPASETQAPTAADSNTTATAATNTTTAASTASPTSTAPTTAPTLPPIDLTTAFEPYITMIFDNIQNNITPGMITNWQNLTSAHIRSFWNDLTTQSVYVDRVLTLPITMKRVDAAANGNVIADDDEFGAFKIVPTWQFRNDTSAPPNDNEFLLKAVSISYNQTIAYSLLQSGDDGSSTTSITDTDTADDDLAWQTGNSELVQQLFVVPFEWGAAPYIQALTAATNNTIPVRLRSVQVSSNLPTQAPTLSPNEIPKVNDDDRTIIITVVITLLSLLFAGGYIIFLTQKEGQDYGNGGNGNDGDRSSMAFGTSARYIYEDDHGEGDDDDDESSSAGSALEGGGQGRHRYYYDQQNNNISNKKDALREQPQIRNGTGGDGIGGLSRAPSSTMTSTANTTSTPQSRRNTVSLPQQTTDMPTNISLAGSDRDQSTVHHAGTLSADSADTSGAAESERMFHHRLPMSVIGQNSFSGNDAGAVDTRVDGRSFRGQGQDSHHGRGNSFQWDGQGGDDANGRGQRQHEPSPLAFIGFQMEVRDLED